jgi:hypothetical protein
MKTNRGTTAAIVVGALLLMSLLALAPTAAAEVVYTPVNVTISGNGSIKIDLNHDGITDFVLRSVSQVTVCGNRGGLIGSTKITPTIGDGVVVSALIQRLDTGPRSEALQDYRRVFRGFVETL